MSIRSRYFFNKKEPHTFKTTIRSKFHDPWKTGFRLSNCQRVYIPTFGVVLKWHPKSYSLSSISPKSWLGTFSFDTQINPEVLKTIIKLRMRYVTGEVENSLTLKFSGNFQGIEFNLICCPLIVKIKRCDFTDLNKVHIKLTSSSRHLTIFSHLKTSF